MGEPETAGSYSFSEIDGPPAGRLDPRQLDLLDNDHCPFCEVEVPPDFGVQSHLAFEHRVMMATFNHRVRGRDYWRYP